MGPFFFEAGDGLSSPVRLRQRRSRKIGRETSIKWAGVVYIAHILF